MKQRNILFFIVIYELIIYLNIIMLSTYYKAVLNGKPLRLGDKDKRQIKRDKFNQIKQKVFK